MLEPCYDDDLDTEHVVRAELEDLKRVSWWKKHKLDGVIFYSWAGPRYLAVAKAIRAAGKPFTVHWDGGSDLLPDADLPWLSKLRAYIKFYILDCLRAYHLSLANYVTLAPTVRDFF